MLRQLSRLTRGVAGAGPGAHALAVYSEPSAADVAGPNVARSARESGFEGVACVDDAARAIVVYCRLWRRWKLESARTAAYQLLRFLAHMQLDDGRFVNFILDWKGQLNTEGRTSRPGGAPWQTRALHALACGLGALGDPEWDERFRRGLIWIDGPMPYLDLRALGILAVLEHWRATQEPSSAERALAWARELGAHTHHERLLNTAENTSIHLWGHLQEVALSDTGRELGRPDFVATAQASAESLLVPLVASAFDLPHVLPFDVSCTIAGLSAVGVATGDSRYASAASRGRLWFLGRNTAAAPVYDVRRGLVYDGIDNGQVSRNSGAESNIEGALSLLAMS